MSGESDVEPDMDMDVSGSEQGTVEVTQDESSAEEEAAFDMENESLLMNENKSPAKAAIYALKLL